jgi:Family of unknown function (DUF6401)
VTFFSKKSDDLQVRVRDLGIAGLHVLPKAPGLLAQVDQHAAAVRDVLSFSGEPVGTRALLDYLVGFTESAAERGWQPENPLCWEHLRVIAVHSMLDSSRAMAEAFAHFDDRKTTIFGMVRAIVSKML